MAKKTMLDVVNAMVAASKNQLTYEEWCYVRNHGTPEEIEEAVERMEAQGGYENLA